MNRNDVRRALLKDPQVPKVIRMNDGSRYRVKGVEQWILMGDMLLTVASGLKLTHDLALRNIASIGPVSSRRRA